MCGIAGLIRVDGFDSRRIAERMGSALRHRGPDASGTWSDPALGVALSHCRLAVIDLTLAGHQPMISSTGRYVIAFNGEIYNHQFLRDQLEKSGLAPCWRGHSDTETLLALIDAWGVHRAMALCCGMWAFALVDRKDHVLHLARDRFGEKPLYYGVHGVGREATFRFGSELAAFAADPQFPRKLNRFAIDTFLRLNYIPSHLCIYAGVLKLPPGHHLSVPLNAQPVHSIPEPRSWWSFSAAYADAEKVPLTDSKEALDALETSLSLAIARQSLADVPLGCFLSGGVDSSLVTALMQRQSNRSIRTFTIGFEDRELDESQHAASVAAYLGTDHTTTVCSRSDALEIVPQLAALNAEPFADHSQIPTYLLCGHARGQGLTVCLSGDGGDELFGGYSRYLQLAKLWKLRQQLPEFSRRLLAGGGHWIESLISAVNNGNLQRRVSRAATTLAALNTSLFHLRESSCSWWGSGTRLVRLNSTSQDRHEMQWENEYLKFTDLQADPRTLLMAIESIGYLPDDLLVKIDRASMSVGLETRAPFLDVNVAAIALRCHASIHFADGNGKWLLRKLLQRHVPDVLMNRPKAGFNPPLGSWLRGPLRHWAGELLSPERLDHQELLYTKPILQCWKDHLLGRSDQSTRLWPVLMLQAWLEYWQA